MEKADSIYKKAIKGLKKIEKHWKGLSKKDIEIVDQALNGIKEIAIEKIKKEIMKKYHDFNELSYELLKIKHREDASKEAKITSIKEIIINGRDKKQKKIIEFCHILLPDYINEDFDEINAFNKIASLDPYYSQTWARIGSIYIKNQDYNSAISAYKKACELESNNKEYWQHLTNAYKLNGNLEEAQEATNQIKRIENKPMEKIKGKLKKTISLK